MTKGNSYTFKGKKIKNNSYLTLFLASKKTSLSQIIFLITTTLLLLDFSSCSLTENALGTLLPILTPDSRYRVFNDLFKQSSKFESYDSRNFGRLWRNTITIGSDLYPKSLLVNEIAGARVNLFQETDTNLIGKQIICRFEGDGEVKIFQNNILKLTLNSNNKNYGNFKLETLDYLMIYIMRTNAQDLVRNIQIIPKDIYEITDPGINKTFNVGFLSFFKPFNLIRFCYWQGQNILKANYQILWDQRVKDTSASQVSTSFGISLEHILELTNLLNVIPYFCIPETADDNYITQFALYIRSRLTIEKKFYLEFGNAYTIMNDIPDVILTQKFSLFLNNYGRDYRDKIVFILSYRNTQYFINAIGMRQTPVNYEYIDAIGIDANFADNLNIFNAYNIGEEKLKDLIMNQLLDREVLINKAYKFAWKIGKEIITFSGNPQLKAPRYEWRFTYDFKKIQTEQNLIYKNQEIQLSSDLHNFHKNAFIKQIFHFWLIRLKNIGIKTLVSPILVDPYTDDRDFVPLLENLSSMDSHFYNAFVSFSKNENCEIPISASDDDIENPFIDQQCQNGCIWGDCIEGKCLCYGGFMGEKCDIKSDLISSNSGNCNNDFVGVNLSGVADWVTELPFIDMMKICRAWIHQLPWGGWGSAESLKDSIKYDENNYPISLPNNIFLTGLMARDLDAHYDEGIYTVLFDGDGTLSFSMDVNNSNVRRFVGKVYIEVKPSTQMNNGIVVQIERTNSENPIRNIRVIRPGFEKLYKKLKFHPMFLSQLKPFNSIRFMDFFNTNAQKDSSWNTRITENFRTYTINGVPIETMIQLSNITGKDMWVNIPYKADDEYITNMANLIYRNLRPDLKLYVEYSNEVWGNLFPGGIFAQEKGLSMGFSKDGVQARFCYLGYITNKISTIFREIFKISENQEIKKRLKIIVSTQAVNADTTRRILECKNTYEYVDAVAIAPYFSKSLRDSDTIDTLFNSSIPQTLDDMKKLLQSHLYYIKKYNLEFYNYESGQGFVGSNNYQTYLQTTAQNDSRMQKVYFDYLTILKQNEVTQTMLYTSVGNWGKYGSWGHLRYSNVKPFDSKKYSGVLDFLVSENKNNICSYSQSYFTQCDINSANNTDYCNNMGICHLKNCFCYENSKGKNCQEIQYIDYIDCGYKCTFDQGLCVLKKTYENKRFYGCNCNTGYKGNECSIPICDSHCSYAGICTKPNTCDCFPGKKGLNCEIDCGCDGHGVCNNTNNECLCDQGFEFNKNVKKCVPLCKNDVTGIMSSENCQGPNDLKCKTNNSNQICTDNGKCVNGKCFCFPGFSGENCEILDNSKNPVLNLPLGINLGGLSYWSTQFIFKNYFYQSSQFISQYYPGYFNSTIQYTWNTEEIIPKQSNGYPMELKDHQKISKLLLRDINLKYPKDLNFVLLYEGDGVIDLGFDAKITKRRANRIEFTTVPSIVRDNGVYFSILKTNPSNPVRNIRIVNTKDEFSYEKDFITDSIIQFMKNFSTIRFMDLMHTNGNNIEKPEDENSIDADTQAKVNGLNTDLVIKLIQYTGASPWICIPHKANDNYVTILAKKLKEKIPKNLQIYIEYSNEVWNQFFEQGKYAVEQAQVLGLENYHKFYAKRSLEIFNIFKLVFRTEEEYRLKFVISTQFVSIWVSQQILTYKNIAQTAHILAVGSYYDCNGIGNRQNAALTAIKTIDEIIQICSTSLNTLDKLLNNQKSVAEQYNLALTAYEAGTSISEEQTIYNGNETPGLTEKLIQVNRDPRMKSIYKSYLNKLKEFNIISNKAPLMLFSSIGLPSKYGSWGVLDYSDQVFESPSHPKLEAIKEFNKEWLDALRLNTSNKTNLRN